MTHAQFKTLKVGDQVTLAQNRPEYSSGHATGDGRIYVPAGTKGIVGAVRVPSVTGKPRFFICVDSPPEVALVDFKGSPAKHWDQKSRKRVAAYREELI